MRTTIGLLAALLFVGLSASNAQADTENTNFMIIIQNQSAFPDLPGEGGYGGDGCDAGPCGGGGGGLPFGYVTIINWSTWDASSTFPTGMAMNISGATASAVAAGTAMDDYESGGGGGGDFTQFTGHEFVFFGTFFDGLAEHLTFAVAGSPFGPINDDFEYDLIGGVMEGINNGFSNLDDLNPALGIAGGVATMTIGELFGFLATGSVFSAAELYEGVLGRNGLNGNSTVFANATADNFGAVLGFSDPSHLGTVGFTSNGGTGGSFRPIPEPGTTALCLIGIAGVIVQRRRRKASC